MQETPAHSQLNSVSDGLGTALRSAREARGLSIHKAAQNMHVSDDIIEALEHEDFASLGAPIFVRGHLRNYARLLGLPEDQILAAERAADKLTAPPLITLQPGGAHVFGRRFAMPVFSVIVIVLLLVLGIIWWQHRSSEQTVMMQVESEVSTAAKPVVTATDVASMQPLPSVTTDVSKLETPAEKYKDVQQSKLTSASMGEVKQTTGLQSKTVPTVHTNHVQISSATTSTVASSLLIHAQFALTQPSWIEVYDASGKRLYYDLAPAGDTLNVSGAGPLQVFLGNAPGVSIEMNGAPFNLAPYTHPDNTARFRLGGTTGNGGPAG